AGCVQAESSRDLNVSRAQRSELIETYCRSLQLSIVAFALRKICERALSRAGRHLQRETRAEFVAGSLEVDAGRLNGFIGDRCLRQRHAALSDWTELRTVKRYFRGERAGHRRLH